MSRRSKLADLKTKLGLRRNTRWKTLLEPFMDVQSATRAELLTRALQLAPMSVAELKMTSMKNLSTQLKPQGLR